MISFRLFHFATLAIVPLLTGCDSFKSIGGAESGSMLATAPVSESSSASGGLSSTAPVAESPAPPKTKLIVITRDPVREIYSATDAQYVRFQSADLLNGVLQPALDQMRDLGGGTVQFMPSPKPYRLNTTSVRGPQIANTPLYEGFNVALEMFSHTTLTGGIDSQGNPDVTISVDVQLGNIFASESKENIVIRNLRIEANDLGNYVFSHRRGRNILHENVHVYYPNWAAFGHSAGNGMVYRKCKAFGHNPKYGHGWAVGGNYKGVRDVNTAIIDAEASGFAHAEGGQGIQIRPVLPDYGMDPALTNHGVKIVGGSFYSNQVGIAVYGSDDAEISGVNTSYNVVRGIEVHPGFSAIHNAPVPAIDSIAAFVHDSVVKFNGDNTRTNMGAGIYLAASNSSIWRVDLAGNLPYNLSIDGDNVHVQESSLGSAGSGQPYHVFFWPHSGGRSSGKFLLNSYSPTLYSFSEGDDAGFSFQP